jgi:hypothetical protein
MLQDNLEIVNEFMNLYNESIIENVYEPRCLSDRISAHYLKFKNKSDRIEYHKEKQRTLKYSTKYYNNNKRLLTCPFCERSVVGLTLHKHNASKKCRLYQSYICALQTI